MKQVIFTFLLLLISVFSYSQLDNLYFKVKENPNVRTTLFDGEIEVIHLYKKQLELRYLYAEMPINDFIELCVDSIYYPYKEFVSNMFWEEHFRSFIRDDYELLGDASNKGILLPFEIDFDSAFIEITNKVYVLTNRKPKGKWYLYYGHGNDMGSLTNGIMYANLMRIGQQGGQEDLIFTLPHEISHQIMKDTKHKQNNLLDRIVDEGLACYFNYVFWDTTQSPAKCIDFTEKEWLWSLENEERMVDSAQKYFYSDKTEIIDKFSSWHKYLWEGTPDRLAYFIGFRILQSYVEENGKNSWKDIYDLPLETILEESKYMEKVLKKKI